MNGKWNKSGNRRGRLTQWRPTGLPNAVLFLPYGNVLLTLVIWRGDCGPSLASSGQVCIPSSRGRIWVWPDSPLCLTAHRGWCQQWVNVTASVFLCQSRVIAPCPMVILGPQLYAVCVLTLLFLPYVFLIWCFFLSSSGWWRGHCFGIGSGFQLLSLLTSTCF